MVALDVDSQLREIVLRWVKGGLSSMDYVLLVQNFDQLRLKYGQVETTLFRGLHFESESELRRFLTYVCPIYFTEELTSWTTDLTVADQFGSRWPSDYSVILQTKVDPCVGVSLSEWKILPWVEHEVILPIGDYRVSIVDVTGLPEQEIFDILGANYE